MNRSSIRHGVYWNSVWYLSLDRAGATLSTGLKRQRVQLARAVRNRT